MFELTPEESRYLLEALRNAHTELLHQLHRVDAKAYRQVLRDQIDLNEQIMAKVEVSELATA